MKAKHLLLAIAALSGCMCANAKDFSESWQQSISSIVVNGSPSVIVSFGNESSATYSSNSDKAPYVFRLRNGVLEISVERGVNLSLNRTTDINLTLKAPVKSITINGSGDVNINSLRSQSNLDLSINGSGDIDIKSASVANISASISGSGDIDLYNVSARDANISLSGSGDIEVRNIDARSVSAYIGGSGDISLLGGSAQSLKLTLDGSGDLNSRVKADSTTASLNGSGDIQCLASESMNLYNNKNSGQITVRGPKPKKLTSEGKNIRFK